MSCSVVDGRDGMGWGAVFLHWGYLFLDQFLFFVLQFVVLASRPVGTR